MSLTLVLCALVPATAASSDTLRYRVEWRTVVAHGNSADSGSQARRQEALDLGVVDAEELAELEARFRMPLADSMAQLSAMIRMSSRDTVGGVVVRLFVDSLYLSAFDRPNSVTLPEAVCQLMAPVPPTVIEFFVTPNGRVVPLPSGTGAGWLRTSMVSGVVPLLLPDPIGRSQREARWNDTVRKRRGAR